MKNFQILLCTLLMAHVSTSCKHIQVSHLKESAEENCQREARDMKFIDFAISPVALIPNASVVITPLQAFIEVSTPNCNNLSFLRWMAETKVLLSEMNTQFMDFAESYYNNFEVTEGAGLQSPIDTLEDNIQVLDQVKGLSKVGASTRDALTMIKNKLDAQTFIVSKKNAKIPEVITAYTLALELGAVGVGQGKVFEERYSRIKFKDINERIIINQVRSRSAALKGSFKELINAIIAKRNDPSYGARIVPILTPSPFYKSREVIDRDCIVIPEAAVMYWEGSELNVNFGGNVTFHLEALGAIASRVDLKANLEGQSLRVKFAKRQEGICTWDELNKIVQSNANDQLQNYFNNGIPDAVNAQAAFNRASGIVDINVLNRALKAVQ
ncbi:MAG: hypothetical protein H7249_04060 [Chitinophagaceae bacterium]|nr:hypothetical protein [Oligoflexus sp.]